MNNFPKITQTTTSLETRDGIRLDMEVYRPEDGQQYPILLMRQPYGRQIASTIVYAHPLWYAAQGYIVVIQDVRGRGSSEGEFRLFAHEREDGEDTISWLSQLEGSTGEVGMYGFSYQGMTQLYAAATKPPGLKTICPAMIAYNLYQDWAFENGAFCLQSNLGWALQLASETARIKGDNAAFVKLFAAAHNLPLADAVPVVPEIHRNPSRKSAYHPARYREGICCGAGRSFHRLPGPEVTGIRHRAAGQAAGAQEKSRVIPEKMPLTIWHGPCDIVWRNKAPGSSLEPQRHRRLCPDCAEDQQRRAGRGFEQCGEHQYAGLCPPCRQSADFGAGRPAHGRGHRQRAARGGPLPAAGKPVGRCGPCPVWRAGEHVRATEQHSGRPRRQAVAGDAPHRSAKSFCHGQLGADGPFQLYRHSQFPDRHV